MVQYELFHHRKASAAFCLPLFVVLAPALLAKSVLASPTTISINSGLCDATLNSGTYVVDPTLGSPIICKGNGPTITGGAELDCGGATIQGILSADGRTAQGDFGVRMSGSGGGRVTGCSVMKFKNGVEMLSSDSTMTFENADFINNNVIHGVYMSGDGTKVLQGVASIQENLYSGVEIRDGAGPFTIAAASVRKNSQGIRIHRDVTGQTSITAATIELNRFHGLLLQSKLADVTVSGGAFNKNVRHGMTVTRYGATGLFKVLNALISGNEKNGMVISGANQPVEIEGVIFAGNGQDGMFVRGASPTISCSEFFDNAGMPLNNPGGSDISETNVAYSSENVLSDMCPENPLLNICGVTFDTPGSVITLPPNKEFFCEGDGPTIKNSVTLDCQGSTIVGPLGEQKRKLMLNKKYQQEVVNPTTSRRLPDYEDAADDGEDIYHGITVGDTDGATNTIQNCIVTGFTDGIQALSIEGSGGHGHTVVTDTTSLGNSGWGMTLTSGTFDFTDVTADDNGFGGMALIAQSEEAGHKNTLVNPRASGNGQLVDEGRILFSENTNNKKDNEKPQRRLSLEETGAFVPNIPHGIYVATPDGEVDIEGAIVVVNGGMGLGIGANSIARVNGRSESIGDCFGAEEMEEDCEIDFGLFSGNGDSGIVIWEDVVEAKVSRAFVSQNGYSEAEYGGGIVALGTSSEVSIESSYVLYNDKVGVLIDHGNSNVEISCSEVTDNDNGVVIKSSDEPATVSYSLIHDNFFHNLKQGSGQTPSVLEETVNLDNVYACDVDPQQGGADIYLSTDNTVIGVYCEDINCEFGCGEMSNKSDFVEDSSVQEMCPDIAWWHDYDFLSM